MRIIYLLCLISMRGAAQDLHFSQTNLHPTTVNPAAAGMYAGDFRASIHAREQWASVPVRYHSLAAGFDWKALRSRRSVIAAAVNLRLDQAGDAGMSWKEINLQANSILPFSASLSGALGMGFSMVQRSFTIDGLRFKNQWKGDFVDLNAPTGEAFNRNSAFVGSLSAGGALRYRRPGTRTEGYLGLAAQHLNRPRIQFADAPEYRLPSRLNIVASGEYRYSETADIVGFSHAFLMGGASEFLIGGGWRTILNEQKMNSIQLACALRLGDAWIPSLRYAWKEWTVGLSYDWNFSPFKAATGQKAGMEIVLLYSSLPVPPVKVFKPCPIF